MADPSWTSWADDQPELSRPARQVLSRLGTLRPRPAAALSEASVPPSRLPGPARAALVAALGAGAVADDHDSRARHAGGQAYADLLRRRAGDASDAPDVVVTPDHAGQVAEVLRVCAAQDLAVVTWGGGTSVVGGLSAIRGSHGAVVALDLSRLDRLLHVDETSLLATFQPGIRTPDAEAALAPYGLTLGHIPQSFERASLGGYAVTRSAGQASSGVGRFDDLLAGCRFVTPTGELLLSPVAGSAAGPDLRRLVLGSEGVLGVVTELTVRVHRLPSQRRYVGWMAPSWSAGLELFRDIAQHGPKPDVLRLSDADETAVSLAMSGTGGLTRTALSRYLRLRGVTGGGCLVVVGIEGERDDVHYRHAMLRRTLRRHGAVPLGRSVGDSWVKHRFGGPRLRDSLLDAGVLAETLETAATWTALPGLYTAVREALMQTLTVADSAPLVGCHVSHLYPTGASLYFTVLANAATDDPIGQWATAKHAANLAITAAGGTASHHHAVGTAHREIVEPDLGGEVGLRVLRAVKAELDPAGILNPGKLIPGP